MTKASIVQVVDNKIVPSNGAVTLFDVGDSEADTTVIGIDYAVRKMDKFHRDAVALRSNKVDASVQAFLLGADGKVIGEPGFVYYGQPKFEGGIVELRPVGPLSKFHTQLNLKLSGIPANVGRIALVSSVHEAKARKHHIGIFGAMSLYLCKGDLNPVSIQIYRQFGFGSGAVVLGEIFAADGKWQFLPGGEMVAGGLEELCGRFGIEVQEEQD